MLILRAICLPLNPTLPFALITIFQSLPITPNLIKPPTSLIIFPMKFRIWSWRLRIISNVKRCTVHVKADGHHGRFVGSEKLAAFLGVSLNFILL